MAAIAADRRAVLAGLACLTGWPAQAQGIDLDGLERPGSRIGLAALDTGSGRLLLHRADERFLMCSTFKLALAAATLRRVEQGTERLDRHVRYVASELLPVSPVTTASVAEGLVVEALCAAVIHVSDNAAANLLLRALGGPAAMTAFFRSLGDTQSRLDRIEPHLNLPEGESDTTTPRAMLRVLQALLVEEALSPASREILLGWMDGVTTGLTLLRAGLPPDWRVGDKTGRSSQGAINDIAIARPPGRAPILVCAYTEGANDGVLAGLGRMVSEAFA